MNAVIDTDVWSYIFKKDTRAQRYLPYLADKTLCVSFQTVAEVHQWAILRNWGATRVKSMVHALEQYLVLPYDAQTGRLWAEISAARWRSGAPLSPTDAWVAACALRYGCPLVTNNASDFDNINQLVVISF